MHFKNHARKTAPTQPPVQVEATPSPGTITPEAIDETDIEVPKDYGVTKDHEVIRRLIVSELAKVVAKSTTDQANTHRVHKSHSRRHHRRGRRYSSKSSTDLEEGDRPMVSFLHHD